VTERAGADNPSEAVPGWSPRSLLAQVARTLGVLLLGAFAVLMLGASRAADSSAHTLTPTFTVGGVALALLLAARILATPTPEPTRE